MEVVTYLLFVDLSKTPLQLPCWLEIVIPRNLRDPRPVRLLRSSTYVKDLVQLFRLQQQKKNKQIKHTSWKNMTSKEKPAIKKCP